MTWLGTSCCWPGCKNHVTVYLSALPHCSVHALRAWRVRMSRPALKVYQ